MDDDSRFSAFTVRQILGIIVGGTVLVSLIMGVYVNILISGLRWDTSRLMDDKLKHHSERLHPNAVTRDIVKAVTTPLSKEIEILQREVKEIELELKGK